MRWLPDDTVDHLRRVTDWPDLSHTKYRPVSAIADGGMGVVYLARDRELDRDVAVKVLKDSVVDDRAARRMRREARIIARLEHPGIVPLHDLGTLPDGRTYYVMKLVRGRQLDQHVAQLQTINDRLRVFGRLCDAVAFAHAHGVIHRDIKPQNVMIGEFGEVLVLDWGVARVLGTDEDDAAEVVDSSVEATDSGEGSIHAAVEPANIVDAQRTVTLITAAGTVVGTPAFMSPEQARGERDGVDQRSDVFALGAVLYWLLTGAMPLNRTTFQQMASGRAVDVTPPRRLSRDVSRPLSAICLKALAHNPADRYADAAALADELNQYLNGAPVTAYRAGVFEKSWRVVAKHRTAVLLILAYLAVRTMLVFFGRR